jgi:hypothetical protein
MLLSDALRHSAWDIRSGNWHIARDGINLLVEACEMRVQSIRLILLILSGSSFFSPRRGLIRALYVHLNEATSIFQLSRVLRTFFALDQTTDDLPFVRNACRYDQRKIRTACGKRPVTTAIDHAPSTDQATGLPEDRPVPPRAPGQDGSDLERGSLHCSARDASAASIVSSSACSGSTHQRHIRDGQGSQPRRSA